MNEENIMPQRLNLNSLKNVLKSVISHYEEKKKISDNATYLIDMYKDIISLLTTNDVKTLYNELFTLNLLFPLIYSNEEAEFLSSKVNQIVYQLVRLSNNLELKTYYDDNLKKLDEIINKVVDEYEILKAKSVVYKEEVKEIKNKVSKYRNILYRLNAKVYLSEFHINEVKKLLTELEYSKEQQIILLEFINHHNIHCKDKNWRASFTTIRMMESDFELYDVNELVDNDIKNKIDSWSNSVFESILSDSNINLLEFIDDMTSWMDKDLKEYAIKKVLNKFLNVLNECKENMLEENNYDDVEIRKIIILEYNSYYYKYLNLKKYYNEKIMGELDEIPDILDENPEDIEEKNHLFFAMTNEKSYVEKDILSIPEEYYERVRKLLEGFRFETLTEHNIETFASNSRLKGYRKLKEDQIRIVYRPLNNNNFLVLGIMLKKSDRANREYLRVITRDYNYDISDEKTYNEKFDESHEIYTNLIEYIDSNSRKGNR